jgi:hypothetical protein
MSDSLIIYISDDCGSTWQRVFGAGEKGQGTFATVPKTTTFFSPAGADEWCGGTWGSKCYTIDLSAWANKPNIKLAFESYNKIGNNLYIDNIKVTPSVGTTILTTALPRINLFPNPSRGFVTLSTRDIHGDILVVFYNQLGSQVYTIAMNADQVQNKTIDLSALPKGVYSVKITGNGLQEQQKIVLQ